MNKKKITIINCFETDRERVIFMKEYFEINNYTVNIIYSDFLHMKKEKIQNREEGIIYIKTPKYRKNISIARIFSHYKFAKRALRKANEIGQDILYIIVPPNFLVKYTKKYKKNKNVKVIFDIYDLWPESIPSKKIKEKLKIPCRIWKKIRENNINTADIVITECDLFEEKLKDSLINMKTGTIYLTRGEELNYKFEKKDKKLELLYLGSINNLIDIDFIVDFISKINKNREININIVGEGEKKDTFIEKLQEKKIEYKYYGAIYDKDEKEKIFSKCDFGINVMKKNVCVGLTMKSLDYFYFGIPILNNIIGDTTKLIKEYRAGINLNNSIDENIKYISNISNQEIEQMHRNVNKMYIEKFSKKKVFEKLDELLKGEI